MIGIGPKNLLLQKFLIPLRKEEARGCDEIKGRSFSVLFEVAGGDGEV